MNLQKDLANSYQAANKLTRVLFGIYLVALFWILVLKLGVRFSYMGNREVNFIPFGHQIFYHGRMDSGEIILNVLVFVPLGIYTGVLFAPWSFWKKLFFFFGISLTVEVIQFVMAVGAFDTTDMMTNTFGGLLGLLLFRSMEKVFKSRTKAQKYINLIAATGTGFMILLLILLKLDMLPIRYR
ncbi:VanZ family protein [Adhaeribacter swui]|uniref:VanZ family protein n=1 Tax=Adhaeribacter swui TaxID=2086471 RepID=A0A7G7GA20_9BACT|nr:VanZ family protein [Adhaeribacter swui]QNF34004.1 VanZ family protein [Adhaeribacter swui]